ncbi:peptidase [Paenibacillus sp. 32O-W]|jgi:sigma-E processing peptidase SpoIIGA|uniref:sigma-E processing peptidase SpoIIGA n=1 Tax=Paenibacillus sp. 32O-W TaxID=1695218 RepID=UPI00071F8248|nr:sigma-E processing peptidase SpoIIGA [Paenibacillus sp. 32O-W]ALS27360.1 peptidase [Paenibacillus sp. 32O-W]
MAVYVDVVFAMNLMIDGSLLLMTAWIRDIRAVWWKVLAAAAIGASYVMLMFVPTLSFLFTFAIKFVLSLLMLWTAFGFASLQSFIRNVAAFYAVNFVAAGAVLGAHYMLQGRSEIWQGLAFIEGGVRAELKTGIVFVLSAVCIGLYIYRSVVRGRRERELLTDHLAEVSVFIGECERRCIGLIDTGNQLYDPLTRTPVMVMEASVWEDELPASWLGHIRQSQVDRLVAGISDEEPFKWQDRLRLVPYRGVNRGTRFMLALKPDSVCIERDGRREESRKVLVALDGGTLSADGAYRAIIHPSLVQQLHKAN